jgi:hypothetical protein
MASAMNSLVETKKEYQNRMIKDTPPPIHVFPAEKKAFDFEQSIAEKYGRPIKELHPAVVSSLEDQPVVIDVLLGSVFGLVCMAEKEDPDTRKMLKQLRISDEWFKSTYIETLLDLIFPSDEDRRLRHSKVLGELSKKVHEMRGEYRRDKVSEYQKSLQGKQEEFRKLKEEKDITSAERDLMDVFVLMLEEEYKSLSI